MKKITQFIQEKFSNVFMAIILKKNEYIIKYKILKNGKILENNIKKFIKEESGEISSEMKKFIMSFQNEYKFVYIAFLLDSLGQNCFPSCDLEKIKNNNIVLDNIVYICIDNKWIIYTSKADIKIIKDNFNETGIDFIYSPYLILYKNIKDKKYNKKNILHMLYMDNSLSILIKNEEKVIFNAFFKIPYKEFAFNDEEDLKPEEDIDEDIQGINLDTIESEDEEFEGFVDIIKLEEDDALKGDDLEEDKEILESVKKDLKSSSLNDLELYGRDVIIFKFLKSAIEEYYNNDKYNSEFLENIVIYNDSNISNDIITMIENDLFLDVEIKSIDVKESMINISIEEVGFEL